jgi:hypothetical protein
LDQEKPTANFLPVNCRRGMIATGSRESPLY